MSDLELTAEVAWALATGGPWPDPADLDGDARFMALALREGLNGVGLASPNPPVGCVLVRAGLVIGSGVHTRAGDPHGEVMALRDAEARGEDPKGSTAFVTLEPCCYQGRTPPCTAALIRAGVKRVVVADDGTRHVADAAKDCRDEGLETRQKAHPEVDVVVLQTLGDAGLVRDDDDEVIHLLQDHMAGVVQNVGAVVAAHDA